MIPSIESIIEALRAHSMTSEEALNYLQTHIEIAVDKAALRDHFAGLAMQSLVRNLDGDTEENIAIYAYRQADEMLAERAK